MTVLWAVGALSLVLNAHFRPTVSTVQLQSSHVTAPRKDTHEGHRRSRSSCSKLTHLPRTSWDFIISRPHFPSKPQFCFQENGCEDKCHSPRETHSSWCPRALERSPILPKKFQGDTVLMRTGYHSDKALTTGNGEQAGSRCVLRQAEF